VKKIITVFASTGTQGGSTVRALLRRGEFRVRAATRDPAGAKAQALAKLGCELVSARYNEPDSLRAALEGAHGAWFVTSFWDSGELTVEAEVRLGRNVAEAASKSRVEHLVYSSLESPAASVGQHFPTFDAKVGVEQEILYAGVPFTFAQVSWYFNNLENNHPNPHSGWYPWPRDDDGAYILSIPISLAGLHGIHNEDVGEAFASIFSEPARFLGRKVALSGELLTLNTMVSAFSEVFPSTAFVGRNPTLDEYKAETSSNGDALWQMYSWYQARMPRGGDLELTKELNPNVATFRRYLEEHQERYKFE
jgi:uncharacterized protein YbjT (DUF2867 family)